MKQFVIILLPGVLLVDLLRDPLAMCLVVLAIPANAREASEPTKSTIVDTTSATDSEWNCAVAFRTDLVSRSVGKCDAHAT